jgi:histidinol dehydrogenase
MIKVVTLDEALERCWLRRGVEIPDTVPGIVADIRRRGDEAVREWAEKLDAFAGDSFEAPRGQLTAALERLDRTTRDSLTESARRIRIMAEKQRTMFRDLEFELDGVDLGHRVRPVRRVAVYAPGGRYPLPSTVLMGVIPARVAGVEEVVVLSPRLHPVTMAAAVVAGADRVFNLGGAHGIAAAAYGLVGIPRVDMIVGPGNRYVTAAKQLLYGNVGIEFPAGPSELLIIADSTADPDLIAADLLGQAEHDPDATPILVSPSRTLLREVAEQLAAQLETLPPDSPARESLHNGLLVEVANLKQAAELADELAPEHLELMGPAAESLAPALRNYGSLFIGGLSAEVFGDYGSGTNHILPTGGAARFTGGVWVGTFLKVLTWQRVLPEGVSAMVDMAQTLALAEGLPAHAASALARRR